MFRKVRISGAAALQGRSPFHFGGPAFHGRRSSRCSSEAELAIEEVRSEPTLDVEIIALHSTSKWKEVCMERQCTFLPLHGQRPLSMTFVVVDFCISCRA